MRTAFVFSAFASILAFAGTKDTAAMRQAYGDIALTFEENAGQAPASAAFVAHGPGYSVLLGSDHASFQLEHSAGSHTQFEMRWTGATLHPRIFGRNPAETTSNYFIGHNPANWKTGIRNYGAVEYQDIYPGVNLIFHGNHRELEYDIAVSPGADISKLSFDFRGFSRIEVNQAGDLILHTPEGDLIERKPVVYEERGKVRQSVPARYVLLGKTKVGFAAAQYDKTERLIIDPVLSYATYLGGASSESASGIAVDGSGDAYITGYTMSSNFPVQNPYQAVYGGGDTDAFVSKLNATGTALVYSTFLGGSSSDQALAIAVDGSGNAYITGASASPDFPTTPGAFQPHYPSTVNGQSPFVAKIDSSGSALLFSTFLGGSTTDQGRAIAVDSQNNVYVAGSTDSRNFPTTAGAFESGGSVYTEAFLAKLNPSGTALIFSSLLGGSDFTTAITGIAIDQSDAPYLTGVTGSSDFPTTPGAFQAAIYAPEEAQAFVTKFNPDGSGLIYSTILRGGNARGIAVDASGNAYVAGDSASADFPVTGTLQNASPGAAFVAKLNPQGNSLIYSVRFGGGGTGTQLQFDATYVNGLALDPTGNVVVVGYTSQLDFPVTDGAPQALAGYLTTAAYGSYFGSPGVSAGFLTKLNAAGDALLYSTALGQKTISNSGVAIAGTKAVAVDSAGASMLPDRLPPRICLPRLLAHFRRFSTAHLPLSRKLWTHRARSPSRRAKRYWV